jgi:hypothetical protein
MMCREQFMGLINMQLSGTVPSDPSPSQS